MSNFVHTLFKHGNLKEYECKHTLNVIASQSNNHHTSKLHHQAETIVSTTYAIPPPQYFQIRIYYIKLETIKAWSISHEHTNYNVYSDS